jgi:hypothetical protein
MAHSNYFAAQFGGFARQEGDIRLVGRAAHGARPAYGL